MRFDIITTFPEAFASYLSTSILKRAQKERKISVYLHNLRDFTTDTHKTTDEKPYGGGAGMVLKAEPILRAVDAIRKSAKAKQTKVVLFSAKGKPYNQKMAREWAGRCDRLVLISGRYEGIDERVRRILRAEEISIGPYVLMDGDVAAMVVISSLVRLLPGVIKWESLQDESHFNLLIKKEAREGRGLEYPHYTRPEALVYKGKKYRVPKILLSGDHKRIGEWRREHRK